jgi:hypothetical protein
MNKLVRRPNIDKSRIIKEFWEDEHVVLAEQWLQDEIMQPGYFEKMCAHEGAHLYYARQIYQDAKICPPSVAYFKGAFRPIESAIDTSGMNKRCDRNRLLTFVKGLQAGGVAEALHLKELSPERNLSEILQEIGDGDDRDNYPVHCDNIRKASPGLEFDDDKIWTDALIALMSDMSRPDIKAGIATTTEEVRIFLENAMYPDMPSSASVSDDSSTHSRS